MERTDPISPPAAAATNVVVHVDTWASTGMAKIYVSPDVVEELSADLAAVGVNPFRRYEFSAGNDLAILGISIGTTTAVWKAAAQVMVAFIQRHDQKEITIDGVSIKGCSADDAIRIAERAASGHRKGEAHWKKIRQK